MSYFDSTSKKLNKDDLSVLSCLFSKDAVNRFGSIDKLEIATNTGIIEYSLRKTLERLELLNFIEFTKIHRFYHYYLTDFGIMAIQKIINEESVEA